MKPNAILFDLDGTLIDSERRHFSCWEKLVREKGITLSYDCYQAEFSGGSVNSNCQKFIASYELDISLQDFVNRYHCLYLERLSTQEIVLMEYALETIRFFKDLGISMGIVTSSSRKEVEVVLKRTQLREYFASILTKCDVQYCKPHPDPYLQSVKSFGNPPEQFIVFEDSIPGIQSAKSASLLCYAVQSSSVERQKMKLLADDVFENLDQAKDFVFTNKL